MRLRYKIMKSRMKYKAVRSNTKHKSILVINLIKIGCFEKIVLNHQHQEESA